MQRMLLDLSGPSDGEHRTAAHAGHRPRAPMLTKKGVGWTPRLGPVALVGGGGVGGGRAFCEQAATTSAGSGETKRQPPVVAGWLNDAVDWAVMAECASWMQFRTHQ